MKNVRSLATLRLGVSLSVGIATGQDTIVSKKIEKAPVIDGQLDDGCWSLAEKTPPFSVLTSENPKMLGQMLKADKKFTDNASTAYICHDDTYLYVAYVNPAPDDVSPVT